MSVSVTVLGKFLADAGDQFRETRFAEGLLNGVVRGVEDWTETSFHRAGHRTFLMHLAAHRKNAALAFDPLKCWKPGVRE